jgi:hypothetical protein
VNINLKKNADPSAIIALGFMLNSIAVYSKTPFTNYLLLNNSNEVEYLARISNANCLINDQVLFKLFNKK